MKIGYTNRIVFCIYFFCVVFLLSSFSFYIGNRGIQISLYAVETLFAFFCLKNILIDYRIKRKQMLPLLIFIILILINAVLNKSTERLINSFKLFQYYIVYLFAYSYFLKNKNSSLFLRCEKVKRVLKFMVLFPILFVIFFTQNGERFFPNSNIMCFYGIVIAFFSFLVYEKKKISCLIMVIFLVLGKTMGPLLAAMISFFVIYFKPKPHNILILLLGIFAFVICLLFSDILVFVRLRNVINILMSLSWYDLTHMKAIDYGEMSSISSSVNGNSMRSDDTSFLFRIITWSTLIDMFRNSSVLAQTFGMYDVEKNAIMVTAPHNDYLWVLCNYGFPALVCVILFFFKIIRKMMGRFPFLTLFIMSGMVYYFTENLITYYPGNIMFYFLLGCVVAEKQKNTFVGV